MCKRLICMVLCCALCLLQLPATVRGADVSIGTPEELLSFAESCRKDSFSQGLTVRLTKDIDLTGLPFDGIPIFSGTFDGGGHAVTGLSIATGGSDCGFFRYLTDTAHVHDLTVEGAVTPTGSRSRVGGITGSNAGTIENCVFRGTVSGTDHTGGIAGINTGSILNCHTEGSVQGLHFVGGIAGESSGVIRGCVNRASVNTEALQNQVELSDITVESITNSEAAVTATDIGGIAGHSSGTIHSCENAGGVGYRHMGYNIGGIAGSQTGFIAQCVNRGSISGRKEVGGIVGQTEPVTRIDFSTDTLQLLKEQLGVLSEMVDSATGSVQGGASYVSGQLGALRQQANTAASAVDRLLPDREDPSLPSLDDISQAQNEIAGSLGQMPGTLDSIASGLGSTVSSLSSHMGKIGEQMNLIGQTMNGIQETLGGTLADVSEQDTDDEVTGKVTDCINQGNVLGDLNIGGIAGSMAFENDLDPEDDVQLQGENSLNFEGQLRSVVRRCMNYGVVTAMKQNAGGVVGWQSMGMVAECVSTGMLMSPAADYVGGITGRGNGSIRDCHVKAELQGQDCVGGIAGSGASVTGCRSMVRLSGSEKLGAVLGCSETSYIRSEVIVEGNLYTCVDADCGGIDGISYTGKAESLPLDAFLQVEGLPELFGTVALRFLFEDGSLQTVELATGDALADDDIPSVPEKFGYVGFWEGLEEFDRECVRFDAMFTAGYLANSAVLASSVCRDSGLPVLLAQGSFVPETQLALERYGSYPPLAEDLRLIEAWQFHVSPDQTVYTARFLLPDNCDPETVTLLLGSEDGRWLEGEFTVEGSYAVFSLGSSTTSFAIAETVAFPWYYIAIPTAGAVILCLTAIALLTRKSRRSRQDEAELLPEEP